MKDIVGSDIQGEFGLKMELEPADKQEKPHGGREQGNAEFAPEGTPVDRKSHYDQDKNKMLGAEIPSVFVKIQDHPGYH